MTNLDFIVYKIISFVMFFSVRRGWWKDTGKGKGEREKQMGKVKRGREKQMGKGQGQGQGTSFTVWQAASLNKFCEQAGIVAVEYIFKQTHVSFEEVTLKRCNYFCCFYTLQLRLAKSRA